MLDLRVRLFQRPAIVPARRSGTAQDGDAHRRQILECLLDGPAPHDGTRALRHRPVPPVRIHLYPSARLCPTSRRIALELESRFKAPMSETRVGQGMCAGKGLAWTVAGNESSAWRQAAAACTQCPLLAQCTADLESRLAGGEKITNQILAGRLFSTQGVEVKVEKIEQYADRCGMRPGTGTTVHQLGGRPGARWWPGPHQNRKRRSQQTQATSWLSSSRWPHEPCNRIRPRRPQLGGDLRGRHPQRTSRRRQ